MIMTLPFCIMTSSLRLVNYKKWICKIKNLVAKICKSAKNKKSNAFHQF